MKSAKLRKIAVVLFALAWAVVGCVAAQTGEEVTAGATPSEDFIRTWLICGPFPNPPNKPAKPGHPHVYDHTPPCVGLDTDYLVEHGGEEKIVPVAGMTHTKEDGTTVKWVDHTSPVNKVVFRRTIARTPNHVAYAYTEIEVDKPGPYLMTLGSDDGVCVWLNGQQVQYKLCLSKIYEDDDLIPVTLKKGKNRILVKVEQGWGGWGFVLRFVPRDKVFSGHKMDVDKRIVTVSVRKLATGKPQEVIIRSAGKKVGDGFIDGTAGSGAASAEIEVPFPPVGAELGRMEILVGGKVSDHVEVRSIGKIWADRFKLLTPRGYPGCVFEGEELPRLDFERPLQVETLVGPYSISVKYHDADYNEVESAEKPGRYGAVVDIKMANRTTRRFVTLFRLPEKARWLWWGTKFEGGVSLPEKLGISADVAEDHSQYVEDFVREQIGEGMARDSRGAILLAGLYEAQADGIKAGYYNQPALRDRAWWLPLKRKLYGIDKKYGEFICPRKIDGPAARVVRKGSLREAGMKRDFAKKMHKYLKKWEADSDQAFAVIIVRHGVIAFHEAYGKRDGKPMTLTTQSWMASATKMMAGSLIMMLVDQGLISLDDRADKHLPPLREAEKEWPATVRNLFRHMSGLTGLWAGFNDMEYRAADVAPYCEVRKRYEYDGAGPGLSCKILEVISGETLPEFFRNHLLGPLRCENTNVSDAGGGASSTPLDMARICQMLLQKGAYGDMRFFAEDVFEQMLPQPVGDVLDAPYWGKEGYGIGTTYQSDYGLGKGTFAHGAASGAFICIDPENDMVVLMTRNERGRNFFNYHKAFFRIILDSLEKAESEE